MKSFRQLYETPDSVYNCNWKDYDAWVFGYYKGQLFIKSNDGGLNLTHEKIVDNIYLKREDFKFPGRLWEKDKIISFWEYPTKQELNQFIQDAKDAEDIDIDNTWKIDVPDTDKFDDEVKSHRYYGNRLFRGFVPYKFVTLSEYEKPSMNWNEYKRRVMKHLDMKKSEKEIHI